ncbi:MAG: hypothetical protein AAGF47_00780 [Planctomycetota bacterium]
MDDTARLVDWLADADEPCPVCGYSLRGITAPACPECNARIELGVRSPDRLVGPWAMMLISCAVAFGFDGVMTLLFSVPILVFQAGPPLPVVVLYSFFVTASLVLSLTIAGLLRWRVSVQRLPRKRQWLVAWGMAGGIFLIHAAVGAWYIWVWR